MLPPAWPGVPLVPLRVQEESQEKGLTMVHGLWLGLYGFGVVGIVTCNGQHDRGFLLSMMAVTV